MKKGLRVFVDNGLQAMKSEMPQLHDRNVMKSAVQQEPFFNST